jgi:hypothetical protein
MPLPRSIPLVTLSSLRVALLASLPLLGCVSQEGEPCAPPRASQPCSEDDQPGVQICVPAAADDGESVWSLCMVEECEEQGATRECRADGVPAVERCVQVPGDTSLYWGSCAVEVCVAGEVDCEIPRKVCVADVTGVTAWQDPTIDLFDECDTPLVLMFGAHEPEFRPAPMSAAAFDISGVGRCTANDWPTAATPWLVRDLDRSGDIEGGHELFGSGTLLTSGRKASHGFEALAELDDDGDRRISPADTAWSELLVWADEDGDRVATFWELVPLVTYGVDELALEFQVESVCDERGNCGRERASFAHRRDGAAAAGQLVDVHLVCE